MSPGQEPDAALRGGDDAAATRGPNQYADFSDADPFQRAVDDSSDDSDAPLLKRRRAQPSKSAQRENGVLIIESADRSKANAVKASPAGQPDTSLILSTDLMPPPKKPHAMTIMKIAKNSLENYAGPNTKELEQRYHQWTNDGKPHDKICLICLLVNTDLACCTCRRVYHIHCLKSIITERLSDEQFYCPLCTKRTWSQMLPSQSHNLDPDDRMLILASHLKQDGVMSWMQWFDDGSVSNDQKMLYDMCVTTVEEHTTESTGDIILRAKSEAKTSRTGPDVKQESVEADCVEVQPSREPSADPLLWASDDVEYIRCVCGKPDDGRRAMICCDTCTAWQHYCCMGLAAHYNPAQYFCEQCKPQKHEKLLSAMERGEKPWTQTANQHKAAQRTKPANEDGNVDSDQETNSLTPQSAQLQVIPTSASEADVKSMSRGWSRSQSVEQTQTPMLRRSTVKLAKLLKEGKKRKRKVRQSDNDGILRGDQAMTALRQAELVSLQDRFRSTTEETTIQPNRLRNHRRAHEKSPQVSLRILPTGPNRLTNHPRYARHQHPH